MTDAERQSCDEYLACLFILVADGGRYQGLKHALDNQYLKDKDAYPCTRPHALKLLEQFKPESTNEVIPGESGGEPGVAFTQTGGYRHTCYNCHAKGHTVNECPKLDEAGKDKFWAAFKSARKENRKRGTTHATVSEGPAPAPTPDPAAAANVASVSEKSEEFEQFQQYMELVKASDNLSLGFAQVGVYSMALCMTIVTRGLVPPSLRECHPGLATRLSRYYLIGTLWFELFQQLKCLRPSTRIRILVH